MKGRTGWTTAPLLLAAALLFPATANAEDPHLSRAASAYEAADYEKALAEYEAAGAASSSWEVQLQIARCLDRLLRMNDAVVAYLRFLHGNADRAEAKEAQGRIAFFKKHLAQGAAPEGQAKLAIERGTALYKLELWDEARGEFEQAVTLLPDRPNAFRWLGLTLEKLGKCRQALAQFEVFLSMVPENDPRVDEVTGSQRRCQERIAAESTERKGKDKQAREPREPSAPEGGEAEGSREASRHLERGVELYSTGKYREAQEEFTIARSLAPGNPSTFRWLGLVDARLEKYAEAVSNLEVFLEKVPPSDPRVPEAREVLASAKGHLKAARSAEPRAPSPEELEARAARHIEQGVAFYREQRYERALEAFERARTLVPERANAYRWMGLAQAQLGKCREALANFDVFLARVPSTDPRIADVDRERERCRSKAPRRAAAANEPPPPLPMLDDAPGPATVPSPSSTPPPAPAPVVAVAEAPPATPPAAEGATAPLAAPAPAPDSRPRLGLPAPIAVGAAALALIGGGAGLLGSAYSSYYDLDATCSPRCADADVSAVRTRYYLGGALLGVGAAAAVADGVLWYLHLRGRNPGPAPSTWIVPTAGGVAAGGVF